MGDAPLAGMPAAGAQPSSPTAMADTQSAASAPAADSMEADTSAPAGEAGVGQAAASAPEAAPAYTPFPGSGIVSPVSDASQSADEAPAYLPPDEIEIAPPLADVSQPAGEAPPYVPAHEAEFEPPAPDASQPADEAPGYTSGIAADDKSITVAPVEPSGPASSDPVHVPLGGNQPDVAGVIDTNPAVLGGAGDTAPAAASTGEPAGSATSEAEPASHAATPTPEAAADLPAALIEITQAATSPAINSDVTPAAATPPALFRGLMQMATVIPPAETVEKTKAFFGDVQNRMGAAFEKSSKMGEDAVEFSKGNVEALMASARIAAKAGEMISQEAAEYGRKSLESATAMIKSMATVKSPTELFQLQSEFARSSFDSAVAEASKLSEVMIKLAGEISQPLSNRYALAAEKMKTTG